MCAVRARQLAWRRVRRIWLGTQARLVFDRACPRDEAPGGGGGDNLLGQTCPPPQKKNPRNPLPQWIPKALGPTTVIAHKAAGIRWSAQVPEEGCGSWSVLVLVGPI